MAKARVAKPRQLIILLFFAAFTLTVFLSIPPSTTGCVNTAELPTSSALSASSCGSGWQEQYASLHRNILNGTSKPRYLVASGMGGFTNSLYGAITLFYTALLTDRAYLLELGNNTWGMYEWAFDQPNFNWTFTEERGTISYWRLFSLKQKQTSDKDEVMLQTMINGDLRKIEPEIETMRINSNAGRAIKLFQNPHHRRQFEKWGLRPETAFHCAVHYLFSPGKELQKMFSKEISLLTDKKYLSIGIHLRVGDSVFFNESRQDPGDAWYDEHYGHLFECASEIEKNNLVPGLQPLWYFVADDPFARQYAKRKYGGKVFSRVEDLVIAHADFRHVKTSSTATEQNKIDGFRAAVGEYYYLSWTNFQVVMDHSGFGRASAATANSWQSAYSLPTAKKDFRGCGPDQYADIYKLSNFAPGI